MVSNKKLEGDAYTCKVCKIRKYLEAKRTSNDPLLLIKKVLKHYILHEDYGPIELAALSASIFVIAISYKWVSIIGLSSHILEFSALLIVFLGILFETRHKVLYDMNNDRYWKRNKVQFERNYISNTAHILVIASLVLLLVITGILSLYQNSIIKEIAMTLLLISSVNIVLLIGSLTVSSTQNVWNKIKH